MGTAAPVLAALQLHVHVHAKAPVLNLPGESTQFCSSFSQPLHTFSLGG